MIKEISFTLDTVNCLKQISCLTRIFYFSNFIFGHFEFTLIDECIFRSLKQQYILEEMFLFWKTIFPLHNPFKMDGQIFLI